MPGNPFPAHQHKGSALLDLVVLQVQILDRLVVLRAIRTSRQRSPRHSPRHGPRPARNATCFGR
jgi:hypothetical protein